MRDNRFSSTVVPEHEWKHLANMMDSDNHHRVPSTTSSRANLAASGHPQGDYNNNAASSSGNGHQQLQPQRRVLSAGQMRENGENSGVL